MILWLDGDHDPAENMRRDAALLARVEASAPGAEPVLRLFRFVPHGITLGASQVPERELDLERCRRDGVPWAVRPTGGRAIFHVEEWTYAFTARRDDPDWGGELRPAYARVASWIVRSLVRLGIPAEPAGQERGPAAAGAGSAAPCFASTGHHEIVLDGRKLVGSAQRRLAHGLLQQGSVLLGPGHVRLADYVAGDAAARARAREQLERLATHAGRWVGGAPLGRWADALRAEAAGPLRTLEGEAGLEALTLFEGGSYTRAAHPSHHAPEE